MILPSTSALILLSSLPLLTLSLYLSEASLQSSLSWYICLSSGPFLCCISVSIHPSESLSFFLGTWSPVKSITSPRPCPPRSTPTHPSSLYTCGCIDKSIHQSLLLCLSLTDLCFDTQRCICPLVSRISLLHHVLCFCLFVRPSVSVRAQPCLLFVFPRRCANTTLHCFITTATESCPLSLQRLLMPRAHVSVHELDWHNTYV